MKQKHGKAKNKKKRFKTGLRAQITVPFVILIVLAVGIVAFVSYNFSVKTTTEELSKNVESQMHSVNDTFDMYFNNMENHLTRLANNSTLRHYDGENFNELYTYFQETGDTDKHIKAVYAGFDSNGEMINYPYNDVTKDINAVEEAWYQDAAAAEGEIIWTDPYVDELTGYVYIRAAKAFYQYNELIGVAGFNIDTTALLEIMNDITIGDNGYAVTIDEAGNYVTNRDRTLLGQNISEEQFYQDILAAGDQGIIEVSSNGEEHVIGFVKNPTTNWMLSGIVNKSEFEGKAGVILIPIAISLGIILVIAIIAAMFLANRITKPIHRLQTTMKQVEDGNLTAKIHNNRDDEIGKLSRSFDHMLKQIRGVMQQISGVARQVSGAAENLVASSEENTASGNEVATTMEEIASGANNQSDLMNKNTKVFASLSEEIQEIHKKNQQMFEKAQQMGNHSKTGIESIQDLAARSAEVTEKVKTVKEAIYQLNEKSTNIHSIVDKISNIASQTNLLALNASIEAARAGEHGHGFSVVAKEVGKLADQTTNALKDVGEIVSEMQDETKHSVDLVKETMDLFENQSISVGETGQAFFEISGSVNENNEMIEQVMKLTDSIVEKEREVNVNTQHIATISEETAAGTEEISASIEQQTASMEQLNHLATDLEVSAMRMQEELKKFKIE